MRIRNYSNTLSYEVITMALRTARRTVPDNIAVSQRLSSCRGSQAVGETGVSQLFGGRGDRWIAGPRRVYPFSKDICFCALQFR